MPRISIFTLGSRGDVQPYVALGIGLKRAGFDVTLATGKNFEGFVREHGLDYSFLDADFLALMQDANVRKTMEGRGNPLALMRTAFGVLRQVLADSWAVAQGSDVIVYHPKILSGYSLAEKLRIPAFMAVPAPLLTPTGDFPGILLPQGWQLGRRLNRASHGMLDLATTGAYGRMVNKWRRESLELGPQPPRARQRLNDGQPVPVLYPFSRHVVPKPSDWPSHVHVTGYWFLDALEAWQPSQALSDFLAAGPPPVYIGFGSMAWNDPEQAARDVMGALQDAEQRGILATGWGGLKASDLPESVFILDAAPHDWLFPRVAAAVHHGGAGTTAASLRAGIPTLVTPFLADQPFWGQRVHALGAGPAPISQKRLSRKNLAAALRLMTSDDAMRYRAAELGALIQAEDGVGNAVALIAEAVGQPVSV